MPLSFDTHAWFLVLDDHGRRLVRLAEQLYEREERMHSHYSSYSFVVFPMAKAYEGFIKKYLHEVGILPRPGYNEHKFRIGRALNPDISPEHKNEWWLYDDLVRVCSREVARNMWNAWVQCRNRLFHFYVDDELPLSLADAKGKLVQICAAMDQAMQCKKDAKS